MIEEEEEKEKNDYEELIEINKVIKKERIQEEDKEIEILKYIRPSDNNLFHYTLFVQRDMRLYFENQPVHATYTYGELKRRI